MSAKISKFLKKMKPSKNKSEDLLKKSKSGLDEQFIRFGMKENADLTLAPASEHNTPTIPIATNLKVMKRFSKSILALGQKTDKQQKKKNKVEVRQNSSLSNLNTLNKSPVPLKSLTPRAIKTDILAIDACLAFKSGISENPSHYLPPISGLPPKPVCVRAIDIEPIYANFTIEAGNNSIGNDESLKPVEMSESDNSFGLTRSSSSSEELSSDLGLDPYMTIATEPTKVVDATYANVNSLTFVTENMEYCKSRQSMPNLSMNSDTHVYACLESSERDTDTERVDRDVASTDSNDYRKARQSMPNISKTVPLICEYCIKVCKNKAGLSSHQRLSKDCKQIREEKRFSSVALSP